MIVAALASQLLKRANVSLSKWRQQQVMNACSRLGFLSERQHVLSSKFVVSNEPRYVYCCLPKVACSSWRDVLLEITDRHKTSETYQKQIRTTLTQTKSYTQRQRLLEKYYKFMFAREPLERLLSAYRNQEQRKNKSSSSKGDTSEYTCKISRLYRSAWMATDGERKKQQNFDI